MSALYWPLVNPTTERAIIVTMKSMKSKQNVKFVTFLVPPATYPLTICEFSPRVKL